MNVVGPRIRIRPTRREDLPFLQALWNDGTVMRSKGYPHGMHATAESMTRWWLMTPQAQGLVDHHPPHCVIALLDSTLIGEWAYSLDTHRRVRIDLKLATAYQGQGYDDEALSLALTELFSATPAVSVIVEPAADDTAARALYLAHGFHLAPSANHPNRLECTRGDYADQQQEGKREVA